MVKHELAKGYFVWFTSIGHQPSRKNLWVSLATHNYFNRFYLALFESFFFLGGIGGHLFVSLLVPLVSLVMWIKSGEQYNDMINIGSSIFLSFFLGAKSGNCFWGFKIIWIISTCKHFFHYLTTKSIYTYKC
jgi:hypothetical protein